MSNQPTRLLNTILLILSMTTATYAQQHKAATIDSMIHKAHQLGVFNGNVIVIDQHKPIYRQAIGFTDYTNTSRLTDKYRFHIGSIAKEFNAVAIMILAQEGKLKLDDNVAQYLPELPTWATRITIQHLLQYTSGLPDLNWKTISSDKDNMNDLKKLTQLRFEPGTNYEYNNNNIFLQRRIIEKISGIPFHTFVEQRIFRPLKMNTAIIDPTDKDPLIARGFNDTRQQEPLSYPMSGWTCVTLDDFLKWSDGINNFRLLTPASTNAILNGANPGQQAGLGRGDMNNNKIINHIHDGSNRSYQALLVSNPPKGRTVILMVNNKQENIYEFNDAIQNILDDKPYVQPKKSAFLLLLDTLNKVDITQFLQIYHHHKIQYATTHNFETESLLNTVGYYLMRKDRLDDAIRIFEYNTTLYPASGNVFDSLGEAYYNKGDKQKALLNYKHSLELAPDNPQARKIVASLENK